MIEALHSLANKYDRDGYFFLPDYFTRDEMSSLRRVVLTFHENWKKNNEQFYQEVAFNSSLITGSEHLSTNDRIALFSFISSKKLMTLINEIIKNKPAFMNTQLFFNPVNPELKDFWHRDCQYDHDIEGQRKAIKETQVVHFRIPLFEELGMELIPGTHKRWDTELEHNVRQEEKGYDSNDALPDSESIPMSPGDLLVFSADMIHRGLYGKDRLALDMLVFDSSGDFIDYVDPDCLPTQSILTEIPNPTIFLNTMALQEAASE